MNRPVDGLISYPEKLNQYMLEKEKAVIQEQHNLLIAQLEIKTRRLHQLRDRYQQLKDSDPARTRLGLELMVARVNMESSAIQKQAISTRLKSYQDVLTELSGELYLIHRQLITRTPDKAESIEKTEQETRQANLAKKEFAQNIGKRETDSGLVTIKAKFLLLKDSNIEAQIILHTLKSLRYETMARFNV